MYTGLYEYDTIAQISTAAGYGGIAIVRISGVDAVGILKRVFISGICYESLQSHTIHYGKIVDGEKVVLDEVLVGVMLAPKTYTREDVVEINCHGGMITARRVLQEVLRYGARAAEPGEFTKRAFLNGRIDLSQAEAISDLIFSKTEISRKNALAQLSGRLKFRVQYIRGEILTMLAHIEASIDYPEHDLEEMNMAEVTEKSTVLLEQIEHMLRTADYGKMLRDGIDTVIVGKPNVGKSSFLNAVLDEERAIVTDIPGTTRDVLQESVSIGDIMLKITDTAGIRETADTIERLGVEKSIEYMEKAELLLIVLDGSKPLTDGDFDILSSVRDKKAIALINKYDLPMQISPEDLHGYIRSDCIIPISAKENTGIDDVFGCVKRLFFDGEVSVENDSVLYRVRHKNSLYRAAESLHAVIAAIAGGFTEDIVAVDLSECYTCLGEITGESLEEDIIDKIFSEFCLGK